MKLISNRSNKLTKMDQRWQWQRRIIMICFLASLSLFWILFFWESTDIDNDNEGGSLGLSLGMGILLGNWSISTGTSKSKSKTAASDVLWVPAEPDRSIEPDLKQRIPRNGIGSPLEDLDCPVTSQMKLIMRPAPQNWILQTLDINGNEKAMGGDEFYITFHSSSSSSQEQGQEDQYDVTAVALVSDKKDGSYELDFVVPPMMDATAESTAKATGTNNKNQGGTITIYLQYSCGIGHMAPPTKDQWIDGGSIQRKYTIKTNIPPPIRPFQPPILADGIPSLSHFDMVLAFGDSAMKQFVKNHSRAYQPNIVYRIKRRKPWTVSLMDEHWMVLQKQLGRDLEETHTKPVNSTALILGSAIWDVLASSRTEKESNPDDSNPQQRRRQHRYLQSSTTNIILEDHLQACRHFITSLRQKYPNVVLYWKSPSAMHIHVVDSTTTAQNQNHISAADRVRYMSTSRMEELYHLQKKLMSKEELNVPVLDIYEATYLSASWTFPGDGRHYRPELHRHMIHWFYQ